MRNMDIKLQEADEIGSAQPAYRVGILPVAGFALMSYASTVEPLRAANLLSRKTLYEVVHFGNVGAGVSSGGALIEKVRPLHEAPELDLLLVVAGGDPFAFEDASAFFSSPPSSSES